jgi:translation initiation factor IF-1
MTKNTTGGKKAKGFARKHANGNQEHKDKLLLSSCDLERYAIVTKMLGNGMFYATTDTGVELIGHIRNKFKGRSKHSNFVSTGSFILIGLRDWEYPNYKNGDLLHIYADGQLAIVHNHSNISSLIALNQTQSNHKTNATIESEDGFQFTNTDDTEVSFNVPETPTTTSSTIFHNEEMIDIDDI